MEDGVAMPLRRPFSREQRTTVINGILCFVIILVILQLWLITATMNAYLGGDQSVIWPAAGASVICLLLNAGLLWYVYRMERT
jgi:multidrug resistance efflux pump